MSKLAFWLAKFEDEASLRAFLHVRFDEDGDADSAFARELGWEWFDGDFLEAEWRGDGLMESLPLLSYSEQFLPRLRKTLSGVDVSGYNSAIAIYQLDPHLMPRSTERLRLIGLFDYKP